MRGLEQLFIVHCSFDVLDQFNPSWITFEMLQYVGKGNLQASATRLRKGFVLGIYGNLLSNPSFTLNSLWAVGGDGRV